MWKKKALSLINILSLSVTISATILITYWTENELRYDTYHSDFNRIFQLVFSDSTDKAHVHDMEYVPYLLGTKAKLEIPGVEAVARLFTATWNTPIFRVNDQLYTEKRYAYIDPGWFDLFRYRFIEGNAASFFSDPFSIILTRSKARQFFGNHIAVGQIIRVDTANYTVRAIIDDNPTNSSFQFDILFSVQSYFSNPANRKNEESWNNFNYVTFLKIAPGSHIKVIETELSEIMARNNLPQSKGYCSLSPIKDMHLNNNFPYSFASHGSKSTLYVFLVIGILLLLAGCINSINLTIANAHFQTKEISIRRINGAGSINLFFRFLIEFVVINIFALLLALLLCYLALPFFNQITDNHFRIDFTTPVIWFIFAAALVIVTMLNSIYPAILMTKLKPTDIFKGVHFLRVRREFFRNSLLFIQFCTAISLTAGTFIVLGQMKFIDKQDLSYDKSQIFMFSLPTKYFLNYKSEERVVLTRTIRTEIQRFAAVDDIAVASHSLIGIRNMASAKVGWQGKPKDFVSPLATLDADHEYSKIFGLYMSAGHWLDERSDTATSSDFVLNETAVREFNLGQPVIGQRFSFNNDTGRIVGVVKDFHYSSVHDKIGPLIIYNQPAWRMSFFVRTAPKNASAALSAAKSVWQQFIPDYPFQYSFLNEEYDRLYRAEEKISSLSTLFAAIALAVAMMGLLGLSSLAVQHRLKEISVRRILGASFKNILILLSREFAVVFLFALIIAIPLTWIALDRWLQDFAYRIDITPVIFALSGILILGLLLCVVAIVTINALTSNLAARLRSE